MKMNFKKFLNATLLVSAIAMLAGCEFSKKNCKDCVTTTTTMGSHDSGKVLATIDGKALVTEGQFNKYVDQIIKLEPQMELYFAMVPDMSQKLFDAYQTDALIKEWVKRTGKDKDASYSEKLDMQKQLLESQMQGQLFQDYILSKIDQSDSVISSFFAENKTTLPLFQQAPFVKTQGGVKAQGVSFADEKQAVAFLEKVKAAGANFTALAKEAKKSVNDFGGKPVNAQTTTVDSAVRSKLAEIATVPSIELIKADKTFWVVKATAKTNTEYAPFEEVKEAAKNVMLQTKFNDELKAGLDALKSEFKVNDAAAKEYFEAQAAKKQAEMQEQMKALQQEQDAAEQAEVAAEKSEAKE